MTTSRKLFSTGGWLALVLPVAWLLPSLAAAQASCKAFAEVKAVIDNVLDKDAAKGAEFRKQFKEGADSIYIIEQLVDAEMAKTIDVCRYDVAEYLTKRGFPPPH